METGMRIAKYLNERGIKQSFLAEKSQIPIVKLNLSLNGRRKLTFDEYERICWALDVSPDKFICPHAPTQTDAAPDEAE